MNRKTIYTVSVLLVYAILIGIFIGLVNKSNDCVYNGPCLSFCDSLEKSSDEDIRANLKIVAEAYRNFRILRGTPNCNGGVKLIGGFSDSETNPYDFVRF